MSLDIKSKIFTIVAQVIHKAAEEIESEALFADLGIGEFDLIEIMMKIEDQFSIILDDAKITDFATVQHIIDHVTELLED